MAQNDLIGNAGVYWVVSELSRRGLVALPTVRNCPGADVLVLDPVTGGLATLQVKTSGKCAKFWPTAMPPAAWRRPTHAYVFVRRRKDDAAFEGFLVGASEVAASVSSALERQRMRGKREFPEYCLPGSPAGSDLAGVQALHEAWHLWLPPAL